MFYKLFMENKIPFNLLINRKEKNIISKEKKLYNIIYENTLENYNKEEKIFFIKNPEKKNSKNFIINIYNKKTRLLLYRTICFENNEIEKNEILTKSEDIYKELLDKELFIELEKLNFNFFFKENFEINLKVKIYNNIKINNKMLKKILEIFFFLKKIFLLLKKINI